MSQSSFNWERVVATTFSLHPQVRPGKIQVHWMSDDELLEVNIKHLNHDYYTDIITFDYSRGRKVSGELFISVDRVKENAMTASVPVEVEQSRVVAHGVLHLIGFGDKTEEQAAEMRRRENEVLEALGYDS